VGPLPLQFREKRTLHEGHPLAVTRVVSQAGVHQPLGTWQKDYPNPDGLLRLTRVLCAAEPWINGCIVTVAPEWWLHNHPLNGDVAVLQQGVRHTALAIHVAPHLLCATLQLRQSRLAHAFGGRSR
jgi:hypothetical protein